MGNIIQLINSIKATLLLRVQPFQLSALIIYIIQNQKRPNQCVTKAWECAHCPRKHSQRTLVCVTYSGAVSKLLPLWFGGVLPRPKCYKLGHQPVTLLEGDGTFKS